MLRAITRDIIPMVWRADRFAPRGFGRAFNHTEGHSHSRSPTGGERLLQYWQERLAPQHRGPALLWSARGAEALNDSEVKDLLHTAVRLRQGRVAGVLPEQVHPSSCSTLVMRQGSNVMSWRNSPSRFFQLCCCSPHRHGCKYAIVATAVSAVQVVAVLMSFYSHAMPQLEDKARFFELLCRDFGTQRALSATLLCCAAFLVEIQSCRAAVMFCTV